MAQSGGAGSESTASRARKAVNDPALSGVEDGDLNKKSPAGLPEGQLVMLLSKRKAREVRALLAATPRTPGDQDERMMWEAACLSREERYDEAIKLFDRVKQLGRAPNLVLIKAAKAYSEEEQHDKAIALASDSIKIRPSRDAYRIRVAGYVMQKRLDLAINDYLALAEVDKRSAKYYMVRAGNLLVEEHKYDKAIALMDRASLGPRGVHSVSVMLVRANCYKGEQKWAQAIDCLTQAIALTDIVSGMQDKNLILPTCYQERAKCYDKVGKIELANADRKVLIRLSKNVENDLIGK